MSLVLSKMYYNCSTDNPCGSHGYCRDTIDGNWICDCKFWWDGTFCEQMTASGRQVIVLGCLVGLIIVFYYGLEITRYLKRKRTTRVINIENPKLIDLALKTAYRSARFSSCIIGCFMLIVTICALLIKWTIIRSIHNEIVDKYQRNQTIYFTPNSFCRIFKLEYSNLITYPIGGLCILIFIVRTKRTSCLREHWHGYGAPPIPADFLSHIDRKFVAVVFAICSDELVKIMNELINGSSSSDDTDGIILAYLQQLLQVLLMGFRYYPILAAVHINSIVVLSIATIYAWLDYIMTVLTYSMCKPDYYPTINSTESSYSITTKLDYYGTGSKLIVIQLCADIPRFLCLAYISVKLPMFLIGKSRVRMNRKLDRDEEFLFRIIQPTSIEMLYVRNLFRSAQQRPTSQALIARLIPKKIYEWRDDFRFSTRIISVYASILLLLYTITIQACVQVLPYLPLAQNLIQEIINLVRVAFQFPPLIRPYLFAVFLTLTIILLQLLIFLVNLRRNLFQLYCGNHSEVPQRKQSENMSYASGNIHFAGYFIGYLIWGFIINIIFMLIICLIIEIFIAYRNVELIEKILKAIIPSLLFVLFKEYANKILTRYIFLQHYGEVIWINNRRILMIFIYFNFFFEAFVGFISSIVRLIKSVLAGVFYMCRLDYSPLGRKLEILDGGFEAYCGFIHTECAHRHPVLLVFIAHIYTQHKQRQLTTTIDEKKRLRYIRKWKLAVFLSYNPTIVLFRKVLHNRLHTHDILERF